MEIWYKQNYVTIQNIYTIPYKSLENLLWQIQLLFLQLSAHSKTLQLNYFFSLKLNQNIHNAFDYMYMICLIILLSIYKVLWFKCFYIPFGVIIVESRQCPNGLIVWFYILESWCKSLANQSDDNSVFTYLLYCELLWNDQGLKMISTFLNDKDPLFQKLASEIQNLCWQHNSLHPMINLWNN